MTDEEKRKADLLNKISKYEDEDYEIAKAYCELMEWDDYFSPMILRDEFMRSMRRFGIINLMLERKQLALLTEIRDLLKPALSKDEMQIVHEKVEIKDNKLPKVPAYKFKIQKKEKE